MALIRPIPTAGSNVAPQFLKGSNCTTINKGDTISFDTQNPYQDLAILNGYEGSFTIASGTPGLNPFCYGVKTDNTVLKLEESTTYDASEFTLLYKTSSASGYTVNISFS
jgi:hypothetical protein